MLFLTWLLNLLGVVLGCFIYDELKDRGIL